MVSCKVYKIIPDSVEFFYKLIEKCKNENMISFEIEDEKFKILLKEKEDNNYGKIFDCILEYPETVIDAATNRPVIYYSNIKFLIQLYSKNKIENLISVFTSSYKSSIFYAIVNSWGKLFHKKKILSNVDFDLTSGESKLKEAYDEIIGFKMNGINDIYVHIADLYGRNIQESSEFEKYKKSHGQFKSIIIKLGNYLITLTSYGLIYTSRNLNEEESIKTVNDIIRKLVDFQILIT